MTDRNLIAETVNEHLEGTELFLVDVKVSKTNVITVTIDGDRGVVIDDCIELSRYIESKLDRDKEDFELTVTSFGLEEYFTLLRQYRKNIGENVEIVLEDGTKENGTLASADENTVSLTTKKDGNKVFEMKDILKTRVIINI